MFESVLCEGRRICTLFLLAASLASARGEVGLRLLQTIRLSHVEGRIDHMAVDVDGARLFLAALGNGSLEVIDLRTGRLSASLRGLPDAQGVGYARETRRLFVALDSDGSCRMYDGTSLAEAGRTDFRDDADNIRYDARARRMYVGCASGGIGVLDAADGRKLGEIPVSAHPEAFELEEHGRRIFVNIPRSGEIAVLDRDRMTVQAIWPVRGALENFPMALDEAHHRLFVGCRLPARLLVFDTETGRVVAEQGIHGDVDEVFLDAKRKLLYASCGAGFIDLVAQVDADHYAAAGEVATAPGARTALFVPELDRLYLAVPHRGAQQAEIRVYEPTSGGN